MAPKGQDEGLDAPRGASFPGSPATPRLTEGPPNNATQPTKHSSAPVLQAKVPMTAVDVLNDRVLPFYEEHGVAIEHLLTDNGRETCGKPLSHPYELYLTIQQIEHRRTQIGSPETNGFCERFHRTVKEEFFAVAFRRTFYESVDQLQADLDRYLEFYNRQRAHQGYRTQGRTPYQAFLDGVAAMRAETEGAPAAA